MQANTYVFQLFNLFQRGMYFKVCGVQWLPNPEPQYSLSIGRDVCSPFLVSCQYQITAVVLRPHERRGEREKSSGVKKTPFVYLRSEYYRVYKMNMNMKMSESEFLVCLIFLQKSR